jgi:hypothetical protein
MTKFSSVHVSPESQYATGTRPLAACGGRNTAKRMRVPVARDACAYVPCTPPKQRFVPRTSTVASPMRRTPQRAGVRPRARSACHDGSTPFDLATLVAMKSISGGDRQS